ncbi:MAG: glycosyltransferase [Chthoniobacteraceae bacterium]
MRVLFDHANPFLLTHGGFQIQIERTMEAVRASGVEGECLRWWDDTQTGDLIHYFGRPSGWYVRHAGHKGLPVAFSELLTGLGSRRPALRGAQRLITAALRRLDSRMINERFSWEAFRLAAACVANTGFEARLMSEMFGAPAERVHVVPNGVEDVFFDRGDRKRGDWLLCTATIVERKRALELATAAVEARTPVRIIGKPYSEDDPYFQRFSGLVANHPQFLEHLPAIADRAVLARHYHEARGFVLLSTMETRSLSAEEAAAGGCPLLLTDLPWAHSVFGDDAIYCPLASASVTARHLRAFYDAAPQRPVPKPPMRWSEVGARFRAIYESVLRR